MLRWMTTYGGGRVRPLPLCLWLTLMNWIGGAIKAEDVADPEAAAVAQLEAESKRLDQAWAVLAPGR